MDDKHRTKASICIVIALVGLAFHSVGAAIAVFVISSILLDLWALKAKKLYAQYHNLKIEKDELEKRVIKMEKVLRMEPGVLYGKRKRHL